MADKFTFFASFYKSIKDFPAEDYKAAMNALLAYAFDGEDAEDLSILQNAFYQMAKPLVDSNIKSRTGGSNGGKVPSKKSEAPLEKNESPLGENSKAPSEESEAPLEKIGSDARLGNGKGNGEGNEYGDGPRIREYDCQSVVDAYNATCVSLPRVQNLSDGRRKAIKARLRSYTLDDLKRAFELVESSSFLKGSNDRNWTANFDWIMKDQNLAKILDGNYNDRKGTARSGTPKYTDVGDLSPDEFSNLLMGG